MTKCGVRKKLQLFVVQLNGSGESKALVTARTTVGLMKFRECE